MRVSLRERLGAWSEVYKVQSRQSEQLLSETIQAALMVDRNLPGSS